LFWWWKIRYEPDGGGATLHTMENDVPMPDINELDEKFAKVVVSFLFLRYFNKASAAIFIIYNILIEQIKQTETFIFIQYYMVFD